MKTKKKLPVDKLVRDIARQPNEFTDAVFKGSATAYKLIIFGLYKSVDTPADKPVIFSQNEFFEKLGLSLGTNSYRVVDKAADELAESFLSFRNPRATNPTDVYICKMPWFSRVEVTIERNLHLFFNPVISQFFDLRLGYTALDLLEIGSLRSFYAMRYYGFAKSKIGFAGKAGNKQHEWWFEMTEEEIRKVFTIENDEYQRRERFVTKVIKEPCEEVGEKTSILIDLEYEKLGKGKYKWKFICHDKTEKVAVKKTDSKAIKNLKQEINAELETIERIKADPSLEPIWTACFEDAFDKHNKEGKTEEEAKRAATATAYMWMIEKGYIKKDEKPEGQLDLF